MGWAALLAMSASSSRCLLAQSSEPQLPLAPPVLFTEAGIYSRPIGELPLLNFNFSAPVDHPPAPGDFFAPGFTGITVNGAPVISSFTSQARPGTSIVLTGSAFTNLVGNLALSDTRVMLYSEAGSGTGQLRSLPILRADPGSVTAQVPPDAPYGVYLVWVQNSNGASQPVRVNAAQAWWIGPEHAIAGDTVGVYGRDLSTFNGESISYVSLRPWGAPAGTASLPVKVTLVNPYKVMFQVPSGLAANRPYEVWVHNGHGGDYGWTGPLKLYLESRSPYTWGGATVSVTDFGATPDDQTDDTAAIQRAFDAASDGDVVKFPAGRFLINRKLTILHSISVEGAGSAATTIEVTPNSLPDSAVVQIRTFPARFRNLGFVSRVVSDLYSFGGILFFDGEGIYPSPSGAIIEDASFTSAAGAPYTSIGSRSINDLRVSRCTFITGYGVQFNNGFQAFVEGNRFIGNWPDKAYSGQAAVMAFDSSEIDVSNNNAQSPDRSHGQTLTRFFVAQGHGQGLASNHYIGNNQTSGLGCSTDVCGEQILFETPGAFHVGSPISWTADTIQFANVAWAQNLFAQNDRLRLLPYGQRRPAIAIIQSGKGLGQYRRIAANTSSSITLDRPWDVPPDQNSVITILTGAFQSVVYRNQLAGFPQSLNNTHLQNGGIFAAYGSQMDAIISRNTVDNVAVGIETTALVNNSCAQPVQGLTSPAAFSGSNCANWGILISENTVTNTDYGIVSWTRLEVPLRPDAAPLLMSNIIRDNVIANARIAAIGIGDINRWNVDGLWQRYAVIEGNTVTDAAVHVDLLGLQSDTVIRGNAFHDTGLFSDPIGIRFDLLSHSASLYDNRYDLRSQHIYDGNAPGPSLQVTQRQIMVSDPSSPSGPVSVRDSGTGPVDLAVSSSVPWLQGGLNTQSLSGENDAGQLIAQIDASGLQPGSYTGTLTVSNAAGTLAQTVSVATFVGASSTGSSNSGSSNNGSSNIGASSAGPSSGASSDSPGAGTPFIASMSLGTLRTDYDGWMGMQITTQSAPVMVTALGRFAIAGNTATRRVKLVDASTGADVPGAIVSISPGAPGAFSYVPLAAPVVLAAQSTYYIVSEQVRSIDQFYHSDTVINAASIASVGGAVYWDNISQWIPEGGPGHAFVPVDFKYIPSGP